MVILRFERDSVKSVSRTVPYSVGGTEAMSGQRSAFDREVTVQRIVACAVLSLVMFGCGSSKSADPNLDAWEREVEIISPAAIGDRQYEELGGLLESREVVLTGYGSDDQAIDTAKRDLRRQAAKLDADAVVIIECGRHVRPAEETNLPTMGPEVICHGAAIRWMD
jgi:hypothetical protein